MKFERSRRNENTPGSASLLAIYEENLEEENGDYLQYEKKTLPDLISLDGKFLGCRQRFFLCRTSIPPMIFVRLKKKF